MEININNRQTSFTLKNKRTTQIISILAVGLAAALIVYGATTLPKKSERQTSTNQNESEDIGGTLESAGNDFSTRIVEKLPTGGYYSLKNITFGLHELFERVVFTQTGSETSGYKVEYEDNVLQVKLYDTRLVDENFQNVYIGPKEITGQGGLVEKITFWNLQDDSMTGIKIFVTSQKPFRVFELQNPARIVVDISK